MTQKDSLPTPRPPRTSATVVLVRSAADDAGIEVLLMRRAERGDHNSNAWVFPGGLTDPRDREADHHADGLDDLQASQRLGLPSRGLDFYLAAVRECFEESGILFSSTPLPSAELIEQWRADMQRGERSLAEFCESCNQRLALGKISYLAHWVTPVGRPKRFDTRFFLAVAPPDQVVAHDGSETVDHVWIRPAEALARGDDAMRMLTPTLHTLKLLARWAKVEQLIEWAETPREVAQTMPCIGQSSQGPRPVTPDEAPYAEMLKLDPQRSGSASCELVPGRAVRLSERLIRVTANNGSMMTGPGTNTYLVAAPAPVAEDGSTGPTEWAVIDPGPADPVHVEAILAAAPGPIRWIFVTHTHLDHSPATSLLRERTGAVVHGRVANHPQWQDQSFVPDIILYGDEHFVFGSVPMTTTLSVIHTPGHASNHLCYLIEEEKTLLTGDHVMQSSTVVINPPDGDMAAYLQSLRSLIDGPPLEWIAPGHGFLMDKPKFAMQSIVEHRLRREAKVVAALVDHGPAASERLLEHVYADVPQRLHAMAMRSLTAHLQKLEHDGRCQHTDDGWVLSE